MRICDVGYVTLICNVSAIFFQCKGTSVGGIHKMYRYCMCGYPRFSLQ